MDAAAAGPGDRQRIGALIQFVKGEVEGLPANYNGVRVIVSASEDAGRSFQIQIIPMTLEL